LGKEFSANVFNEKFGLISKISEPKSSQSFNPENQGSDFGGVFSIFSPETEDFPNEEMQPVPQKKKKKRRYGRGM
jgi:hypothetical protein